MRSCVYIHIYTVCVYIPQNHQGVAVKKNVASNGFISSHPNISDKSIEVTFGYIYH